MGKYKIRTVLFLSEDISVEKYLDKADICSKYNIDQAICMYSKLRELALKIKDYALADECTKRIIQLNYPLTISGIYENEEPADHINQRGHINMDDPNNLNIFHDNLNSHIIINALNNIIEHTDLKQLRVKPKPFWFVVYEFFTERKWINTSQRHFFDWMNHNFNTNYKGQNRKFSRVPERFLHESYKKWPEYKINGCIDLVAERYSKIISILEDTFTLDKENGRFIDKDEFYHPGKIHIN